MRAVAIRFVARTVVPAVIAALLSAATAQDDSPPGRFDGMPADSGFGVIGTGAQGDGGSDAVGGAGSLALREEISRYCDTSLTASQLAPECLRVVETFDARGLTCDAATPGIQADFFRTRASTSGTWSAWAWDTWTLCIQPSGLLAAIQTEWDSLAPTAPPLNLQPGTGWVYATVPTIAFTDDEPLIHDATLLGVPVRIRATPAEFAWSWGDGSETVTADAGSPYPDYSLSHTYLYVEGAVEVALVTTWSGDYSVNGGPWIDIEGTITTLSGPVAVEVYDPQSRLVDCDLAQRCNVGAT